MAGNITTVDFSDPRNILVPDAAVQQAQLQRNYQLAQALREQAMDTSVPQKGTMSWTQGLAKIAQALTARQLLKRADQQATGLGQKYAGAIRGMFGASPGAASNVSRGTYGSGGVEDDGSAPAPTPTDTQALAAAVRGNSVPQQPAAGTPAPSNPSPDGAGAPAQGPLSLTGDPNRDAALYMMDPQEYMKGVISASGPVDMAKMVRQAQTAMANGDYATASALLGQVRKQNFIEPTNMRGGSTVMMNDGSNRMLYNPQVPEGFQPVRDAQGNVTGIAPIPGGMAARQASAAAEATGQAAGDVVDVYNPATQQMVKVPKSAILSGAANGGQPFAAAAPIGATSGADQAATNSANQFNTVVAGAQGSQDRAFGLSRIGDLARGLPTGVGATALNDVKSGVNTLAGAVGAGPVFDNDSVAKVQEIQKIASQLAQQQSAALGGGNGSSDARLAAAFASLPDSTKAPQAIRDITTYLQGNEAAIQAKAQAASRWQAQHGPGSYAQFSQSWQQAYDPQIFQLMQAGPQGFAAAVQRMPMQQRQAMLGKYRQLKALGALGQ